MNSAKKALIIFLGVLAFKDAMLGSFLLFNLHWLLNVAGLGYSNDVMIMASFFGVCVLIVSTLCIGAISYVLKNKKEGVALALFIGWWMIIAAIIVYLKIAKPAWSAIDFLTGILIVIPAYIFSKDQSVAWK